MKSNTIKIYINNEPIFSKKKTNIIIAKAICQKMLEEMKKQEMEKK